MLDSLVRVSRRGGWNADLDYAARAVAPGRHRRTTVKENTKGFAPNDNTDAVARATSPKGLTAMQRVATTY